MDKIPLEVLREILSRLDSRHDGRLAPYATVCRAFQFLIEARTFAKIKIDHSAESMKRFEAAFASKRRRCLLRTLTFTIHLPDRYNWSVRQLRPEHDRRYTIAVNELFAQLHKWTNLWDHSANLKPFNLSISPMPVRFVAINPTDVKVNKHPNFPSVTCVDKIKNTCQQLYPRVISTILKAQPSIKHLSWKIDTITSLPDTTRLNIRASTASVLSVGDFSSLEVLQLHHMDPVPFDQDPPKYINSHGKDRLSLALNQILKLPNLKELDLRGAFTLSPEIFNINEGDDVVSNSLQNIRLDLSRMTPAGEWYFTSNRGSGRQHPKSATLDPFLVALARAIVRMPALKLFSCLFPGAAFLRYYAPGTREPCRAAESTFVFSTLEFSRWVMHFEMTARCKDGRPLLSDWNLPPELVEVLKGADHRIFLMRGCLGVGSTSEEL
ncbi:hypothetical protein F4820DRAFT_433098 [Hypoxylon rubiginosum]|uniref:Uncharacterized protein n=1 Tax=Hypoxylon rubiginosum TaxID=110542 RepID=A0ACB9YRK5_9PEZI|nr:hypothetical protein F4820DRAFT_433098 [Hypoxylon rubiginosum]